MTKKITLADFNKTSAVSNRETVGTLLAEPLHVVVKDSAGNVVLDQQVAPKVYKAKEKGGIAVSSVGWFAKPDGKFGASETAVTGNIMLQLSGVKIVDGMELDLRQVAAVETPAALPTK